ncbi:alpha/beta fold hydrolase [Fodinicola feengrottensis]|uniref:Alpha/beta hydrolase n=1 Tax=Fodinicola feengrottensis TaxID=435914 RepID=A0ABN2HEF7_9ACTN|nr:alpha/beta hydrolase [Fodinicola feengrottensis]
MNLTVDGATLYYEVRGSGPVLLMIPGGGGDAGYFGPIAAILADRFTVVTYDRRGNSRSPLDGPPADLVMAEQSTDALRLLETFGDEPAYVFGNSLGAVIGIDLAIRHPERVRALVAHEAPLVAALPDPEPLRLRFADIHAAYVSGGVMAAVTKMTEYEGGSEAGLPGGPELGGRLASNFGFFVGHEMPPTIQEYEPDLEKLRTSGVPVVVGVGEPRKDTMQDEIQAALAAKLGVEAVDFPSYHHGYLTAPEAFAQRLMDSIG